MLTYEQRPVVFWLMPPYQIINLELFVQSGLTEPRKLFKVLGVGERWELKFLCSPNRVCNCFK